VSADSIPPRDDPLVSAAAKGLAALPRHTFSRRRVDLIHGDSVYLPEQKGSGLNVAAVVTPLAEFLNMPRTLSPANCHLLRRA
jgi:hypothetical protein